MGREEGRIFPYCSSGHECMCVCAQCACACTVCLRSCGSRLVCGFLRGNPRLMGTRLCLLTAYPAILESKGGGDEITNAAFLATKKINK